MKCLSSTCALVAALTLSGCGKSESTDSYGVPNEIRQKISESIRKDEKAVKDHIWSNGRHLEVGVINDGSRRDGFASYLCQVVNDHGAKGMHVKVSVIDIWKWVHKKEWVELGSANCM